MSLILDEQFLSGFVTQSELDAYTGRLAAARERLHTPDGQPKGWRTLPCDTGEELLSAVETAARTIREEADILLVIGIGGSYLGAKAALDFLPGANGPEVLFLGNDMSPSHLSEVLSRCEGREIAVNVISKSGSTTEPAIAFRLVLELMQRRYGSEAARRIWCTTDPASGILRQMCEEEGWSRFEIPRDVGGRFSVLTPVGLLPIAAAGHDIRALMEGARTAQRLYDEPDHDLLLNPAYRYAAIQDILSRKGKSVELFGAYEPFASGLSQWLIQLYGESCGKDGKGLFPASAQFSTDLHSLGQYIQEGQRILCETVLDFADTGCGLTVPVLGSDHDGLGYLEGRSLSEINRIALMATAEAHWNGGVPVTLVTAPRRDAQTLGRTLLLLRTELCCIRVSAGDQSLRPAGCGTVQAQYVPFAGQAGLYRNRGKIKIVVITVFVTADIQIKVTGRNLL